jgi:hypothetical protein
MTEWDNEPAADSAYVPNATATITRDNVPDGEGGTKTETVTLPTNHNGDPVALT